MVPLPYHPQDQLITRRSIGRTPSHGVRPLALTDESTHGVMTVRPMVDGEVTP